MRMNLHSRGLIAWAILSLALVTGCGGDDTTGSGGSGATGTGATGTGATGTGATSSGDAGSTGSTGSGSTSGGDGGSGGGGVGGAGGGSADGWKQIFADEFDAADGSPIDTSKWTAEIGGEGWGNAEREYYTDSTVNARQEKGSLVITATTEGVAGKQCWYGPCEYTSARLLTRDKFEFTYGRIEARIQVAFGNGIWPAFWMLGKNIGTDGWPKCGEIDVMENIGKEPSIVHGTLHGPGYSGADGLSSAHTLEGAKLADAYHVYAVEWEPDAIRFYFDDILYATKTPTDLPAGGQWVYDHDFFLLLNLAVGGYWPGMPDATTTFPQKMLVDYVRVSQKE